jgi:predicted DNA-binding protein (UPF0251 family)
MPRPCCCRRVNGSPAAATFKPVGIPIRDLEEVVMTLDEFEALRLADLEGLYQEQAAAQMKVSRPTFSRIIESARRKTSDGLRAALFKWRPDVAAGLMIAETDSKERRACLRAQARFKPVQPAREESL